METALRRMATMVESFADAFVAWLGTEGARPQNWPIVTWVLIGAALLLLWWLARRRRPTPLDARPPQLLVTQGEVIPHGSPEPTPRGRRRPVEPSSLATTGSLVMTVSNLSRYPVQLLEVALRENRRGAPDVTDVNAIVPAMGSVSVEAIVPLSLRGDGWLDVYSYATVPRTKTHRHRVELVWEPWAARFKVAPLDQVATPTRRLAGDEPNARFLDQAPVTTPSPTPAPARTSTDVGRPASARETTPRAVEVPAPADTTPPAVRRPAASPPKPRRAASEDAPRPSRAPEARSVDVPPPTARPRPSAGTEAAPAAPSTRTEPRAEGRSEGRAEARACSVGAHAAGRRAARADADPGDAAGGTPGPGSGRPGSAFDACRPAAGAARGGTSTRARTSTCAPAHRPPTRRGLPRCGLARCGLARCGLP